MFQTCKTLLARITGKTSQNKTIRLFKTIGKTIKKYVKQRIITQLSKAIYKYS